MYTYTKNILGIALDTDEASALHVTCAQLLDMADADPTLDIDTAPVVRLHSALDTWLYADPDSNDSDRYRAVWRDW